MLRKLALIAVLPLLLAATPASAATDKDKAETCKVGADDQKLDGAKRDAFIAKCMAKGNYQPQVRKDAKKNAKPKAPAAPAAAAPPANYKPQ